MALRVVMRLIQLRHSKCVSFNLVRQISGNDFGNFKYKDRRKSYAFAGTLVTSGFILVSIINLKWLRKMMSDMFGAFALDANFDGSLNTAEPAHNVYLKPNFHDRKMIEYENRLRAYSSSKKVFQYFATVFIVRDNSKRDAEWYMTVFDFVRSVTFGKMQSSPTASDEQCSSSVQSLFDQSMLISYQDYLFLITLLSSSTERLEIAFKLFDLNNNGSLDYDEFNQLQAIVGRLENRQRIEKRQKLSLYPTSSLANFLFGSNLDRTLCLSDLLNFRDQLRTWILQYQFDHYSKDGRRTVSTVDFGQMVLCRSKVTQRDVETMLNRLVHAVDQREICPFVSLQSVRAFYELVSNVEEIETALASYQLSKAPIDRVTFGRLINIVAGNSVDDNLANILFVMFNKKSPNKTPEPLNNVIPRVSGGKGALEYKSFIRVMRDYANFGFTTREKKFSTFFSKLSYCIDQQFKRASEPNHFSEQTT